MVPHITTILQRFTSEWAMLLQPEAILTVCREIGYTGLARPCAHASHHHAALPVADAAWQHRVQPLAPPIGLTVHGGGLLSSTG
jgi:hypothetical protein